MKHEDFNIRYNEVMFDERDVIINFLDETADLRYGNQMFEYTLEPMVELVGLHGGRFMVREIRRDKDAFVKFVVTNSSGITEEWEAHNFAYGELSKIIDALPEPAKFSLSDIEADFKRICTNYNTEALLQEYPFSWKDNKSVFDVHQLALDTEGNADFEIHEIIDGRDGGWGLWNELDCKMAKDLRDHLKVAILRCSEQYKELAKHLNRYGGNCYNMVENKCVGAFYITPRGTDLQLDVLDVSMEGGGLKILVGVKDTRLADIYGDAMTLYEKDIEPDYLDCLLDFFREPDIMDTRNAHNKELVEKINRAWHQRKYRGLFGGILLALLIRDHEEYEEKFGVIDDYSEDWAMEHAHEIMYEICDDQDLECILNFIRYEE